jgi:hypothetical protein
MNTEALNPKPKKVPFTRLYVADDSFEGMRMVLWRTHAGMDVGGAQAAGCGVWSAGLGGGTVVLRVYVGKEAAVGERKLTHLPSRSPKKPEIRGAHIRLRFPICAPVSLMGPPKPLARTASRPVALSASGFGFGFKGQRVEVRVYD